MTAEGIEGRINGVKAKLARITVRIGEKSAEGTAYVGDVEYDELLADQEALQAQLSALIADSLEPVVRRLEQEEQGAKPKKRRDWGGSDLSP